MEKIYKKLSQRDRYYYRPKEPETKYDKIRKGEEPGLFGGASLHNHKLSRASQALSSSVLVSRAHNASKDPVNRSVNVKQMRRLKKSTN